MSTSSQIADVPTPFSPLLKLNLPSPEEYRKRKVALISGEYCRVLGALNRVSFSLVACRYHRAGWVVLVSGPSLPPFVPSPCLGPTRSCDVPLALVFHHRASPLLPSVTFPVNAAGVGRARVHHA